MLRAIGCTILFSGAHQVQGEFFFPYIEVPDTKCRYKDKSPIRNVRSWKECVRIASERKKEQVMYRKKKKGKHQCYPCSTPKEGKGDLRSSTFTVYKGLQPLVEDNPEVEVAYEVPRSKVCTKNYAPPQDVKTRLPDAIEGCSEKGQELATIRSATELRVFNEAVKEWAAGGERDTRGLWLGGRITDSYELLWPRTEHEQYQFATWGNWESGMPMDIIKAVEHESANNHVGTYGHFVAAWWGFKTWKPKNGQWRNMPEVTVLGYICQYWTCA
jgi:hypothetical protein